jgi:hypothetical protein
VCPDGSMWLRVAINCLSGIVKPVAIRNPHAQSF